MNGRTLNRRWNVNASHVLHHKSGKWYHKLKRFPGALFDQKGYVLFQTEEDFFSCEGLSIKQDVWVSRGISSINSYVQVIIEGMEYIPPALQLSQKKEEYRIYYEGNPVSVNLTRYERDRSARDECLRHYGHCCIICGLDFDKTYGEIANGMIHVHHLIPIGDIGMNYVVDPVRDMRPVCPNCHSVIHKRNPPFKVDEVKNMLMNVQRGT